MRKKIVAGNWKMHKTGQEARDLFAVIGKMPFDHEKTTVVVLPPSIYLSVFAAMEKKQGLYLGAQNSYPVKEGAYTGEVSAYMLNSLGVEYCLVGHSERRKYFHETDTGCLEKVKVVLEQQMIPVLCVGEELQVREADKHFDHVKKQVLAATEGLSNTDMKRVVIAYEPVWAIGTGKTASTQQASEMHTFIRQLIHEKFDALVSSAVHILYGGSVNENNARELMSARDIDGVLVGGASLKADSFAKIIAAAE